MTISQKMVILGLTGSMAMGKSTIAQLFEKNNVPVFDSDAQIHKLYQKKETQKALKTLIGKEAEPSFIKPSFIGQILLKKPELFPKVEEILYPALAEERRKFIKLHEEKGKRLVLFDIPLLFEKNMTKIVDKILVVDAPFSVQKARALSRPNMTEEKFFLISQKQFPNEQKCALADYVIKTDKALAFCEEEVKTIIAQWQNAS